MIFFKSPKSSTWCGISALWASRCTSVHYGQSGVHQCTMGNQEETSAPWESKWYVARLPSIFLYFLAISGTYLRLGRSKWHTLKAKKHLLDVANAGKGPTPSGGSRKHQEGTLFWQIFAWAGNFLGRSYCLQVANMLMFALTATLPINR